VIEQTWYEQPGAATESLNDLTVVTGYRALLEANGLDSLDSLFSFDNGQLLSKPGLAGWRERWRLTLDADGETRTFYLKRFRDPPRSVRREVAKSRSGAESVAGLEWIWMNRLAGDGIPCPSPVAFGQQLDGTREMRSAVITAAVQGASLESWVRRWGQPDRLIVRGLIRPVARLVAGLHRAGYVHRDLYLSHVFYDPTAPAERGLRLIDLQRVFRPRWRMRRWIVKDLAALEYSTPVRLVSRADRLRWLREYLGKAKLDASARRLCYLIVGKAQRIARHDRLRAARVRDAGPVDRNG
jgi:hypothetical protein